MMAKTAMYRVQLTLEFIVNSTMFYYIILYDYSHIQCLFHFLCSAFVQGIMKNSWLWYEIVWLAVKW